VYKLDLFERTPAEAGEVLQRYLGRTRVESGEMLEAARHEYRSQNRRLQARTAIPEAWRELVEKGDELLVELVASAVESKVGFRADEDDVAEFLISLGRPFAAQADAVRNIPSVPKPPVIAPPPLASSLRGGTLTLAGKQYSYKDAKNAMLIVLRELAKLDPSFLERCSQHPDAQGRTRRYLARRAEDLYPERPDLQGHHEILPGGWVVATNLNNVLKMTIIKLAAEVAGLQFGRDLIVNL